ncbi:hypothetical protein LG634_22100 [Streptomyces bambusae]|uniref:glycoside hydrolase family 26 protein n=1 Tax=Streptomyces bambusae TaxID=1550616 RepID=UPI001CFD8E37|nr:glycosyl hydrolase [Streptomyces bambusae]MCB5167509.1 hypothetical protein [Streptomyces bambusae]
MSHRGRRLAGACTTAVAAAVLAVGGGLAPPSRQAPGAPAAVPAAAPAAAAGTGTAVGAYLHYGSPGVDRMQQLSRWLGGTDLRAGHTYLPGDTWENIEGAPSSLLTWARWRKARPDRLFVLNVPMQADNEAGVPDDEVARRIRAGAQGAYDRHYRRLAARLVALGLPDTVLVLGWEMNGFNYTHRCRPDPENWKRYWRRIVTQMRAAKGQRFRFDFAPNRGSDAVPWTRCYPGDDVVDILGMDSYDQPPGENFDDQITQPYGLRHHVDFAKAHRKRISYPEWGLFRNGDNPEYMRRMLAWIARHKPLYHSITDYCPHGVWQCTENPRSAQVFRSSLKPAKARGRSAAGANVPRGCGECAIMPPWGGTRAQGRRPWETGGPWRPPEPPGS